MLQKDKGLFKEKFRITYDDIQILLIIKELMMNGKLEYSYGLDTYCDYTLQEIKMMLERVGINLDAKSLYKYIMLLLVNEREIIRNDVISGFTTYRLLDERHRDSSFQKHYGNFEQSFPSKMLVIADTHLGNDKIEDIKLINNVYDYGIKVGCNVCLHMGDLFNGVSHNEFYYSYLDDTERQLLEVSDYDFTENEVEELERQLKIFADSYPKCNPEEIKTFVIPGNNDKNIDRYLGKQHEYFLRADIRGISLVNPSVYALPFKGRYSGYSVLTGNLEVHFHHFFYNSQIIPDCKISSYADFFSKENVLLRDYIYNILISGHLHEAFLMSDRNIYSNKNLLYIGVPSLGQQNLNNVVAYMLYFNYDKDWKVSSIDISVLNADSNRKITTEDIIHHSFESQNKRFVRKLTK